MRLRKQELGLARCKEQLYCSFSTISRRPCRASPRWRAVRQIADCNDAAVVIRAPSAALTARADPLGPAESQESGLMRGNERVGAARAPHRAGNDSLRQAPSGRSPGYQAF